MEVGVAVEVKYYDMCSNISDNIKDAKQIEKDWKWIFIHIITEMLPSLTEEDAEVMFNKYEMCNFKPWNKDNTEYAHLSKEEMLKEFKDDLYYCSDRMTFDRLFRCHWLYQQCIPDELYRLNQEEEERVETELNEFVKTMTFDLVRYKEQGIKNGIVSNFADYILTHILEEDGVDFCECDHIKDELNRILDISDKGLSETQLLIKIFELVKALDRLGDKQ